MKIGLYPFASTSRIPENLEKICAAARLAARQGVRLLAFHECALCGYPPLETTVDQLSPALIEQALAETAALAKTEGLYLAVGTVRYEAGSRYNSVAVFAPSGACRGYYDKSALWGWDLENFARGTLPGIFDIEGLRVGFRICFDVRFPEPFRALYRQKADLCFVSFSDTKPQPSPERYGIIRSHLVTRAVENGMAIASVNSLSACQTAPTAFFDRHGRALLEARPNEERLLVHDFRPPEETFGSRGIAENNRYFLENSGSVQRAHF